MTVVAQSRVVYELRSINLINLPDSEQQGVLERFSTFLNSLTEPISFHIVEDMREVDAVGVVYTIPYKRFFIEAPRNLDFVAGLGTKYVTKPGLPQVTPKNVTPRFILDTESNFVQVYNVTRLGGMMIPGFLSQIYPLVYGVQIDVQPIDPYEARRVARNQYKSLGNTLLMRQSQGRSLSPDDQVTYQRMGLATNRITAGFEKLFRVRMNIVLREKSFQELVEARRKLKQCLGNFVGEIDSPRWLQYALLTGRGPSWATGRFFYMTTSTAVTLFPFSGLDIIDPEGTFLGQNKFTGNAVVYDLFEKENYNLAIAGSSGYGKSTLVKTYLSRMLIQDKEMMAYVFDSIVKPEYAVGPDGSYEKSFAGVTNCKPYRFDKEKGAGLDPFAVFPDKRRAANFLTSVAKVEDEPSLVADLYLAAEASSNVKELVENSTGDLKRRLEANLPPYRFLFEGQMDIYPRMVFVLYDLPPGELRDAAAFLTLSAVWRQMQDTKAVPVSRRKIIVIDEGWSLVEINPRTGRPYFPLAVEYVPEISRTGRHYNCAFLIATQLVTDLLGRGDHYGPGRTMIESCATKVILKQDQAAADVLGPAFNLSEAEKRFVVNARIGEGILLTPDGHTQIYNYLSDFEKEVFTTRPKEVTG